MSDRLEDLNVPPKLLAAIRHEVRSNTEQQLNDLWMVVHSLKNASPGAAEAGVDDGLKQELGELQQRVEAALARLDEFKTDFDGVKEDLKKRVQKLRKLVEDKASAETPAVIPPEVGEMPHKMVALLDRVEKLERDTGQLGGAAALFENRLADQESRILRRVDEVETRVNRQLTQIPSAAAGPAAAASPDELSTAALMGLEGSVDFSLADYAKVAIKYNASDLVIRPNSLPYTYLEGDLIPMGQKVLTSVDSYRVTMLALQRHERQQLLEKRNFSKLVEFHGARFLLNAYFERGELSSYARRLTPPPMSLDSLDLPRTLEVSLLEDRGLILLCGSSVGTLKSLAYALMQPINQQRRVRILTYEDAIVYELPEEQSLLSQLQRGVDVPGSSHLLRLRPDVLYLQRIETVEDLQIALDFASDRTLVLAGCSGSGVVNSLQQVLEIAPQERRSSLLAQLGAALKSVLCYRQPQPSEYLINSAKVRPWLERGDFAALQTAVETSTARPAGTPSPSGSPGRTGKSDPPLPHPSTESLSAVSGSPGGTGRGRQPLQPPPQLEPPSTESESAAPAPAAPTTPAAPTEPAATDGDKSGGDEETLLGWL